MTLPKAVDIFPLPWLDSYCITASRALQLSHIKRGKVLSFISAKIHHKHVPRCQVPNLLTAINSDWNWDK